MEFIPHGYQQVAMRFMRDNPASGLFLDMGLGKTVTTLTTVKLLRHCHDTRKPLIIAPKLVTEHTWSAEIAKWSHLKGMRLSRITGNVKQRLAAIAAPADLYAVSRDNLAWMVEALGARWDYDWLIVDESSSFKNPSSKRSKALRKVRGRADRVTILTGTPAPNGLMDLWSQIYLLDQGERLGSSLKAYRERYFHRVQKDAYSSNVSYELKKGAKEAIYRKIDDICISMRSEDWIELPELLHVVQPIALPNMQQYQDFEREWMLELLSSDGTVKITPSNTGALYNKLLQFCNGAVYDSDKTWHLVQDTKLEALLEEVEAINGNPVLVFYQFRSDYERIRKAMPCAQDIRSGNDVDRWNAGLISTGLVHAAGMGHGLNMQEGGRHLLWYGLPWSLELFQQAIKRLHRPGQTGTVISKAIIAKGTVEELVWKRLCTKEANQNELIEELATYARSVLFA